MLPVAPMGRGNQRADGGYSVRVDSFGSAKKRKQMPRQKTYKRFGEDVKGRGRQMERQGGFPTAPGLTPAGEEQQRRGETLSLT